MLAHEKEDKQLTMIWDHQTFSLLWLTFQAVIFSFHESMWLHYCGVFKLILGCESFLLSNNEDHSEHVLDIKWKMLC